MNTTDSATTDAPVEVYWRPGCGACTSMRLALAEAGVTARFHDIWTDPDAAGSVRSVAGGNETVPTVRIGAQVLVAPRPAAVLDQLRAIDPALAPTTRRWPPLRIVQWAAILGLLTTSEVLSLTGHGPASWAADGVAVVVYPMLRRLRSRSQAAVASITISDR